MSQQTTASYAQEGWPTSEQMAVWREVDRKLERMGSMSPSAALQKTYDDHQQRLNDLSAVLPVPPDCTGVAFAVHGQLAGIDLFDQPATLGKRSWPGPTPWTPWSTPARRPRR